MRAAILHNLIVLYSFRINHAAAYEVRKNGHLVSMDARKVKDIVLSPFDILNQTCGIPAGAMPPFLNQNVIQAVADDGLRLPCKVRDNGDKARFVQILPFD